MQKSLSVYGVLALAVACGLLLVGCGRRDEQAAVDTAQAFMKASEEGDAEALKATLTKKARENVHSASIDSMDKDKVQCAYTFGQAKITDDTAQVPVTIKDGNEVTQGHFMLRREEGEWRIYALSIPGEPGQEQVTLDFENSQVLTPEMMKAIGQGMGEMMKAMGQGMGEMMKGMGQGMGEMMKGIAEGMKAMDPKPQR